MYLIFTIISLVKTKNKVIKKMYIYPYRVPISIYYFNLTNKVNNFIFEKLNELSRVYILLYTKKIGNANDRYANLFYLL